MGAKLKREDGGRARFWCPACNDSHLVAIAGPSAWGFNGSDEAPTLTPSVLVTSGHFADARHRPAGDGCWCTYNAAKVAKGERPSPFTCYRCHSFVVGGRIEFLNDCSHALRGWHDLPDYPQPLERSTP